MDVLHDRRRGGGGERDPRHPRPRHGPQLAELEVVGPEIRHLRSKARELHIQIIHPTLYVVLEVPSQFSMGQTVQSGAAGHSLGFEDENLGSSLGLLGQ